MSSNLDSFVRKTERLANEIQRLPKTSVTAVARVYQTSIAAEIASVTSGGKLRGVGKTGAKVGVRSIPVDDSTVLITKVGPLHLIENNTKAHSIPKPGTVRSRRRRRTSSTGRAILVIGGNVVTGPVPHPGTTGKHPFARGANRAEALGALEAGKSLTDAVTRSILG